MFTRKVLLLIAFVGLVLVANGLLICAVLKCGCAEGDALTNGAVISLERRTFPVSDSQESYVEYPSPYSLTHDEYVRLVAFVDGLVNAQPHDVQTVFRGRMIYGDSRYFSYELDVFSEGRAVFRHATYDRARGVILRFSDLVPESGYAVVRRALRAYAELLMPACLYGDAVENMPNDWPVVKNDNFFLNESGVCWFYTREESGMGSACEMLVGWDKIADVLKPDMRPTGCYASAEEDAASGRVEGWRFPFVRLSSVPHSPPADLFVGTNYPYASISCTVESPEQGGLSAEAFVELQSFLGTAICPHGECTVHSVREGVDAELHAFWKRYLQECREHTFPSDFAVFEMEAKLAYRGPEYVSYRVMHQDGCPCCAMETNVVWSWSARRGLTSDDLFALAARPRVRQLMQEAALREFASVYEEGAEPSLPDYAKDWPHTLENFLLDDQGVTWTFGADEVLIGGKGPATITIPWNTLWPCLRPDFRRL